MSHETPATARPWRIGQRAGGGYQILDADGFVLADRVLVRALADQITRAVNRDHLVERAREVLEAFVNHWDGYGNAFDSEVEDTHGAGIVESARRVLADLEQADGS